MKLHVRPNADGTTTVYLERTLPMEGRSRMLRNLKPEEYRDALRKAVAEMRGESAPESPERL